MDEKLQLISIGEAELTVPSYYRQVDPPAGSPDGSAFLMTETGNAECYALLYSIPPDRMMPFSREVMVGAIREAMDEDQGIIEVATGGGESPYIYSIVKHLMVEEGLTLGVEYIVSLDMLANGRSVHVQGLFVEAGTTGVRDNVIAVALRNSGDVGPRQEGWRRDPYDESWTRGALMNLSEQREFDEAFPAHPLSMARMFVDVITGSAQ